MWNQILHNPKHQKYGINPGISGSGIYPIPAAESKVGYIHTTFLAARNCGVWYAPKPESMPNAAYV
jgi:hypothetical protein